MPEHLIQPLRHLPLPVRNARNLVPTAGGVRTVGNNDQVAAYTVGFQSGLQMRGLHQRHGLIPIAVDEQKRRRGARNMHHWRCLRERCVEALLRDERPEQRL